MHRVCIQGSNLINGFAVNHLSRWLLRVALLAALLSGSFLWLDVPLATHLRELPDAFRTSSEMVTELGKAEWYLIPLGIAGLVQWAQRRQIHRQLWLAFAQIAIAGLSATMLKTFFGRCRPKMLFADEPAYGFTFWASNHGHTSFPSGHAAVAFAAAVAFSRWHPRSPVWWLALAGLVVSRPIFSGSLAAHDILKDLMSGAILASVMAILALLPRSPRLAGGPALLLGFALIIALSRILLGAHYLSDVIAGATLGAVVAHAVRVFAEQQRWIDRPASNASGKPLNPSDHVAPSPIHAGSMA